MANETRLTWAKAHSHWLESTDFLFSSPNARLLWFALNIFAREASAGGALLVGDKPMTVQDIAYKVNLQPDEVESALQELEKISWVTREGEIIFIVDYVKDQVLSGDDLTVTKSRDYGRMRTRKHDGKETNRDRVVKSKARDVIRALGGTGFLNPNMITQILDITNRKLSKNAVTEIKKILEDDKENDQDFLGACYDLGYIPLDDSSAYDQVWEMLKNQKPESQKPSDTTKNKINLSDGRGTTTNEIIEKFCKLKISLIQTILADSMDTLDIVFTTHVDDVKNWLKNFNYDADAGKKFSEIILENGWSLSDTNASLKQILIWGDQCVKYTTAYDYWDEFEKLATKYHIKIN